MRSKISCFNYHIASHTVIRYWPLWAIYAVTLTLLGPVSFLSQISFGTRSGPRIAQLLLNNAVTGGSFFNLAVGTAGALAVFTPLYGKESSVMEASLPISRETRYITSFLSGLFSLAAVQLVVFIFLAFINVVRSAVPFKVIASWMAMMFLQTTAFYGIACFAAMLTGRLLIAVGLAFFMNFAAVVFGALGTDLLEYTLYGYWNQGVGSFFAILSPLVQMLNASVNYTDQFGKIVFNPDDYAGIVFNGWKWLLIYAAAGLVFAFLGLLLYKRRKLETAGETSSEKAIRPLFLGAFTLFGGLALSDLITETFSGFANSIESWKSVLAVCLCLLLSSFIAYIFGVMILNRSVNLKHRLRGFLIPAALVVTFGLMCLTGMLGWSTYVPDVRDIKNASVYTNGYWGDDVFADSDIEEILRIQNLIIAERNNRSSENRLNVWFDYTLNNGKEVKRMYTVPRWQNESEPMYALESFLNRPDIIKRQHFGETLDAICSGDTRDTRCELYIYYDEEASEIMDNDDAREIIIRGIISDIDAGILGKTDLSNKVEVSLPAAVSEIPIDTEWTDPKQKYEGVISVTVIYKGEKYYTDFVLTPDCVNTISALHELGYIH